MESEERRGWGQFVALIELNLQDGSKLGVCLFVIVAHFRLGLTVSALERALPVTAFYDSEWHDAIDWMQSEQSILETLRYWLTKQSDFT